MTNRSQVACFCHESKTDFLGEIFAKYHSREGESPLLKRSGGMHFEAQPQSRLR